MSFAQSTVPTYTVSTFAGGGGPNGDGGWAANALLRNPHFPRFDALGNLIVIDEGSASIRKIAPNGLITTVAGTGTVGYSGDGGPADRAQLSSYITGIAIASNGDLYISDSGNNRVRVVSAADGRIRTFVENSQFPGPILFRLAGVALDSAGNLYLGLWLSHQVYRIAPDGTSTLFAGNGTAADTGDGGPAASAALIAPTGIAIDASDTVYIADENTNRIRKVTPDGIISAVAGNGRAGFSGDGGPATQATLRTPLDIALDSTGNLFIGDTNNYRIRKVSTDGTISTVAGTGSNSRSGDGLPATAAAIFSIGVAVAANGDLYLADGDSAIRVVSAANGIIHTAYGRMHFSDDGAAASEALFYAPAVLVGDRNGNFYIGDRFQIRKIDTSGMLTTIAGRPDTLSGKVVYADTGDGGPATAATMNRAFALAVDPKGNVYFSSNNLVRRVDTNGIITTFAGGGTSTQDGVPATQASLSAVGASQGIAIDSSGTVYIADTQNHKIRKVTPDGLISTVAGTGAASSTGNGGPATAAAINTPYGMAFDSVGNLYFADYLAARVRKISPDGTISAFAGTGVAGETGDGGPATQATLTTPYSVAVDSADNVYICDYASSTVRVVTTDGIIHTIASGSPMDQAASGLADGSFGGDGGPAIGAHYGQIAAAAFDGSSNIYILDSANERIRVLTPNQQ
jgi:sugar lactone lactonase YvrE